jgi:hypothetical protein
MKLKNIVFLTITFLLICNVAYAEVLEYKAPSDNVELDEGFEDVLPVLDSTHLSLLKVSKKISTNQGTTEQTQYLRFGNAASALIDPVTKYTESDEGKVGSFIYIQDGHSATEAFFEYEAEFSSGLKSTISTSARLDSFDDITIKLFADDYTIVDSDINQNSEKVSLTLASSSVSDLIAEGETKIYTVDINKYEITAEAISSSPKSIRLRINGQETKTLEEDEYYSLSDDTVIGVKNILVSTGEVKDVATIFIGARIIEIEDTYSDEEFNQGGLSINRESLSDSFVLIKGEMNSNVFILSSIKYRAAPATDLYIPKNKKLSEVIEDSSALLGNWDIYHTGFTTVQTAPFGLNSKSNQEYELAFENQEGEKYYLPFLHSTSGLGDASSDLYIKEAENSSHFLVAIGDYIVLSSGSSRNSRSYALKYNGIDTTNKIVTFDKLTSPSEQLSATYVTENMPAGTLGEGTLNLPSVSSKFYIQDATGNKLAIDLNGGGNFDGTSVDVITKGGAIIDLGTTNSISFPYTLEVTTESSAMEEASLDEAVGFQVTGGTEIGINHASFSNIVLKSDSGDYYGMTTYGAEFVLENVNNANPERLTVNYPNKQRFVDVKIELLKGVDAITSITEKQTNNCNNNIMDGNETGIDCGGSCPECKQTPIESSNETNKELGSNLSNNNPPASTQSQDQCPNGCIYIDGDEKVICLSKGESINQLYCESVNKLLQQKRNGEPCNNNFECVSNKCEDSVCGKKHSNFSVVINVILILFLLLAVFILFSLFKE